jgi:hypothetical protein
VLPHLKKRIPLKPDSLLEEGRFELVVPHAMATVSETVSLAWVKGTGIMPEN